MGIGKSLKKHWNKYKREIVGITSLGASEVARELSGYNQMKQMEDLANAQTAAQEQQLANAQRQASINAGNVQQVNQAGTEDAISKLLKKKTALQRSIRTTGQQRLGD